MLIYPFTDPRSTLESLEIVSGEGCYVTDSKGKRYLDAVAGLWCASLGFSEQRLVEAAHQQMQTLPFYHSFMGRGSDATNRLARKLAEKLPGDLNQVFFACSGSEVVDTAVKFSCFYQNARGKPNKKRIVAREGAYHGSGIASAGLTAMTYCHDGFDLPTAGVLRTGRPHFHADARPGENEIAFSKRRAVELDALIRQHGSDTISAFIAEPVIGSGGAIPPPEGYWTEIQEVLERHDVLLIADEIITGFGRTGRWFACERYDIHPAMMTMAKQLSGAYFPISALAIADSVYDTIANQAHAFGTLGHGFTYSGHPVGAAVAYRAIEIYEEMDLESHVGGLSSILADALGEIASLEVVADVRQVGLMAGVELAGNDDEACALAQLTNELAMDAGVLFRVIDRTLAISPPLVISADQLLSIVDTLHRSIVAATTQELNT